MAASNEALADKAKDEDGAELLLSQIFGNVTVTFTADDRYVRPLPLDDPNFVKGLQSKTGVTLKCELKFDNGEKRPAKWSLEGSWEEIGKARKYFRKWLHEKNALVAESEIQDAGIDASRYGSGRGGPPRNEISDGVGNTLSYGKDRRDIPQNEIPGGVRNASRHGNDRQDTPQHGSGSRNTPQNDLSVEQGLSKSEIPDGVRNVSRHGHGRQDTSQHGDGRQNQTTSHEVDISDGVRNASRHRNGRQDTPQNANFTVEQGLSRNPDGHRQQTTSHEVEIREKLSNRNHDGHSEPQMPTRPNSTTHKSSGMPQRSDPMTPKSPDIAANSNMLYGDQESSPEVAAVGGPSDLENINFVPVDAGVYCYVIKMYGGEIKKIERQFKVKISSQDMDINESSMVKIVPDGSGGGSNIRGANEAVVDLYSTVFSEMKHRVVQLEESSISRESLQRALVDVESLYKDVMVIFTGRKVMIYGMKELDVKVVKSMITTRLYDTGRSKSRQDDLNDRSDDMGRSGSRNSQVEQSRDMERKDARSRQVDDHRDVMRPEDHIRDEQPPHIGLDDHGHQNAIRNQQDKRFDVDRVTQRSANHSEDREYVGGFEADNEGQIDDRDQDDSSPRLQEEDVTPRVNAQMGGLKYRFKHNRLTFKTTEGLKVKVYQADITKETVGAIVNAANESLIHAGGVAGAIERAAGPLMSSECKLYIAKHGMLYPSKVMSTSSGNLPCRYIIHAVGPRWEEYKNKDECYETLKTTFLGCLEYAEKLYVAGISMPLISSGIFGMPLTACIDALYEALTHYSQSWHRDVNVLKEVNIVEIDRDTVKTMQEYIFKKITGEPSEPTSQHMDTENSDPSDQSRSQNDPRYTSDRSRHQDGNQTDEPRSSYNQLQTSQGRREPVDPVDEIFDSNRTRMMHTEGSTQTSLLYPGTDDHIGRSRTNDLNRFSQEMNHYDVGRFGAQRFSSLPNLPPEYDDHREYPASNNRLPRSTESRSSSHVKISTTASAFSHDFTRTKRDGDRLHNDTSERGLDFDSRNRRPEATNSGPEVSNGSQKDGEMLGAVGGVKETPDDLIQTILTEHEKGRQTPEQAAETQKLIDQLLGGDDPRRPREKGHRSRRTQSLDRVPRRSKEKDAEFGGYDLHSDARVKKMDREFKMCSVCFSNKELTERKDCDHKLCRSCYKLGLYKGSCGFCKQGSHPSSHSKSTGEESRGRSRSKKMPDAKSLNPRGQSTKNFHIRPSANSAGNHRKGPMTVPHVTSPPSSPRNLRLEPVGQAPDVRYGTTNQYMTSQSNSNSRTEAWVSDSSHTTKTSHLATTSKQYDHRTYASENAAGSYDGSSRSARERRRNRSSADDDDFSRGRTERDGSRSGGNQVAGGAGGDKEDVSCPICMEGIRNPKTLSECRHTFCVACIDKAMQLKAVCPICNVVYGPLSGNQPAGTMTNYVEPTDLPGYDGCGTIVISYRFPDGVQGEDHTNPGQQFKGTARMAYLPNNIEGQRVFRLLEKAFKARLLFTIGQSVTTGEQNCVIWNDVHHKTRRTGGSENHGYPDPGYLKRVTDELSAKGIK